MKFQCTTCGHKLSVSDGQAGRQGRCPHCREVVTIPSPTVEPQESPHNRDLLDLPQPVEQDQSAAAYDELRGAPGGRITEPEELPHDKDLLDLPQPVEQDQTAAAYEGLRGALGGHLLEPEELPQRKYPWMLDILLYPLNASALTILLICVGGPFFLRVVAQFCLVMMTKVQMMFIPWVVSMMIHWAALILMALYLIWYVFQAIRDSAQGGIRAPNTGALTPGFAEMFTETFRLLASALFCMAPALLYLIYGGAIDAIFWTLFGAGGFALPMAVLAVVMYESLRGLNPFLLLRSIARTFLPYILLAPLCYVLCLMFPLAYYFILSPALWHWSYVLQGVAFYLMLIMAHLLGRFYFKYEEKLYWDA